MRHSLCSTVLALATVVTTVLASSDALGIKVSPPPTQQYASQAWVGFSTDDSYAIRIQLNPDGTGAGVLLNSALVPEPFAVSSWHLNEWTIVLSIRFRDHQRDLSRITGLFKRDLLSYSSGMLPRPDRHREHLLPGRLDLSFREGNTTFRFAAWPERDLSERLHILQGVSAPRTPGPA